MAKLIGMTGSVQVASAVYPVSEWNINVNNDTQDVTDTASGGWYEGLAGINSAETTFTAFWGSAVANLSTTFAIGTTVVVTLNIGNSAKFFTGSFIIKTFSVKNNAKTPVEFSCTGVSTGVVTMPA
jgi:predicted secreted protein